MTKTIGNYNSQGGLFQDQIPEMDQKQGLVRPVTTQLNRMNKKIYRWDRALQQIDDTKKQIQSKCFSIAMKSQKS